MADLMPSSVQCCRCSRQFPVCAQMNLDSGDKIPMFVVLSQVSSVKEALKQATCQVCLAHQGPADRGLYEILKELGLKDEDEASPPREVAVVIHAREEHAVPTVGVVVSGLRPREVAIVDPLMGTAIQVTRPMEPPARDRRPRTPPRDHLRLASIKSRVPRALRAFERVGSPPLKVKSLTGAIGIGRNQAVLEQVQSDIRQRDEDRRRERAKKFGKLLFYLRLTLARIRKNAAKTEVWDLVETFERKLGEAVSFDPQSRGRKKLFAKLGTSEEDIQSLCFQFYQQPRARGHIRNPEIVTVDAFKDGRRSESWDMRGGRKPVFYEFEVVRTKSSFPVPDLPLPSGDSDPRPRIVYLQGGEPTSTSISPDLPAST